MFRMKIINNREIHILAYPYLISNASHVVFEALFVRMLLLKLMPSNSAAPIHSGTIMTVYRFKE